MRILCAFKLRAENSCVRVINIKRYALVQSFTDCYDNSKSTKKNKKKQTKKTQK